MSSWSNVVITGKNVTSLTTEQVQGFFAPASCKIKHRKQNVIFVKVNKPFNYSNLINIRKKNRRYFFNPDYKEGENPSYVIQLQESLPNKQIEEKFEKLKMLPLFIEEFHNKVNANNTFFVVKFSKDNAGKFLTSTPSFVQNYIKYSQAEIFSNYEKQPLPIRIMDKNHFLDQNSPGVHKITYKDNCQIVKFSKMEDLHAAFPDLNLPYIKIVVSFINQYVLDDVARTYNCAPTQLIDDAVEIAPSFLSATSHLTSSGNPLVQKLKENHIVGELQKLLLMDEDRIDIDAPDFLAHVFEILGYPNGKDLFEYLEGTDAERCELFYSYI